MKYVLTTFDLKGCDDTVARVGTAAYETPTATFRSSGSFDD